MTHTNTEQERAEVVAWRWRKPVVNDQGETVGATAWELSDAPGFLPWWTNDPLIRLSDYEALQAECENLRKDAARYQALVKSGNFAPSPFDNGMWGLRASSSLSTKAELDAAVDRVIAAQAKQKD